MARLPSSLSKGLEQKEGALGCLANALILLELVELRVKMAGPHQPGILDPAMDDLMRARRLIERTQHSIAALPIPPAEVINAAG